MNDVLVLIGDNLILLIFGVIPVGFVLVKYFRRKYRSEKSE
jgi:hypothetical protein